MSYIEFFTFDKDGDSYDEYMVSNAWQGAMAIWTILGNKYVGSVNMFSKESMKQVWDLVNDEKIPIHI